MEFPTGNGVLNITSHLMALNHVYVASMRFQHAYITFIILMFYNIFYSNIQYKLSFFFTIINYKMINFKFSLIIIIIFFNENINKRTLTKKNRKAFHHFLSLENLI